MKTTEKPIFLDSSLSAAKARTDKGVRLLLTGILREARVRISDRYFYRVDFEIHVYPSIHTVSHDLCCDCSLGLDCPAVTAVKHYLQKNQGRGAEIPAPGFFPSVPRCCPTCGANTLPCAALTSPRRGAGWRCEKGGSTCYWRFYANILKTAFDEKWKSLGRSPETFKNTPSFSFQEDCHSGRIHPDRLENPDEEQPG